MRLVVTRDREEFAAHTEAFLALEMERNIMAGILASLRAGGRFSPAEGAIFAYRLDGDGRAVAAALRTPPWPLLASGFGDQASARELMRAWLAQDPGVPGINAEPLTARAIAEAWAQVTGGSTRCRMREAAHVLGVGREPPRPARGRLRVAARDDRDLLIEYERAFVVEAGVGVPGQEDETVDRRLAAGSQFLWDHDGPVATVVVAALIAGTARIGPVYTPPEHRRRGYASSAVAALSRHLLSSGARRCMLYTDLANPTSNAIYASVGYRRLGDCEWHAFQAPS
ncbi:MAG: GNAT family N-acetyltransferase [Solirubrobacteraceae bacterium]